MHLIDMREEIWRSVGHWRNAFGVRRSQQAGFRAPNESRVPSPRAGGALDLTVANGSQCVR